MSKVKMAVTSDINAQSKPTLRSDRRLVSKPEPVGSAAPDISFVVHSFNRVANVEQLATGLRRYERSEIIVCDDGSLDGSREKWRSLLDRPNEFIILSNDLHEIRILDRALNFATADIVCLIQDDDTIPHDRDWIDAALTQFRQHPNLSIIGGFMGFNSCNKSPIESRDSAIWEAAEFQFVWHVNIGPYFIRKAHYAALGGWDYSFSEVGEPGIGFDSELCLRAWLNGFQVGYMFAPIKGLEKQYALEGGTMLFSNDRRMRNQWRNHKTMHTKYGSHNHLIAKRVDTANAKIKGAESTC